MVARVLIDEDKMLVTKAGIDALGSSIAETDKIFDSRWPFMDLIISEGFYAGSQTGDKSIHYFPDTGNRPLVDATFFFLSPFGGAIGTSEAVYFEMPRRGVGLPLSIQVFSNRFEVDWPGSRNHGSFRYRVYGV